MPPAHNRKIASASLARPTKLWHLVLMGIRLTVNEEEVSSILTVPAHRWGSTMIVQLTCNEKVGGLNPPPSTKQKGEIYESRTEDNFYKLSNCLC